MPRSTYHRVRSSIQYWCHSPSSPGLTKYSISICSNSRVRKMKLPGVISLRKLLPISAMPKRGVLRVVVCAVPLWVPLALGQLVGKWGDVARGLPGLALQEQAGVEADDVLALLH